MNNFNVEKYLNIICAIFLLSTVICNCDFSFIVIATWNIELLDYLTIFEVDGIAIIRQYLLNRVIKQKLLL